jgi:hypothetical protein
MNENQIRTRTNPDTERSPQLPRHDEPTTDCAWRDFGGVDGDGDFFQTHADSEQDTTGDELSPFLHETLADGCEEREPGGDEDYVSAAEPVV